MAHLIYRYSLNTYVKLPPRADRFYGGPEVEIEIGGKRTHARLDTGISGQMMLLKSTADYLEIKSKFHPLADGGKIYDLPLALVGEKRNITVHAPVLLAEDVNPRLDNDIIPAHLFTKQYAISFYRDHVEFSKQLNEEILPLSKVCFIMEEVLESTCNMWIRIHDTLEANGIDTY